MAHTLGKVALHDVAPAGALSFAGVGVPARVAALLEPAAPNPRPALLIGLWSAIAVTGLLAAYQLHHLMLFITAVCPV